MPIPGEAVGLTHNDIASRTITFDYDYASPLGAATINNAGSGVTTLSLSGAGRFASPTLVVGSTGKGIVSQSSGTLTVQSWISIGDTSAGSGTYALSGGSAAVGEVDVGYNGSGVFTQSGGTLTVGGQGLYVGANSSTTSFGTFTLNGTSVLNAVTEYIGPASAGVFRQDGGTHTVSGLLQVGGSTASGAVGTLLVDGGVLSAGSILVNPTGFMSVGLGGNVTSGTIFQNGAFSGGNGQINSAVFGASSSNSIFGTLVINGTLTSNAGASIGGAGTLAPGATGRILASGRVTTNVLNSGTFATSGGDLFVNSNVFNNTGTLQATAGLTLSILANSFTNTGNIRVDAGGAIAISRPVTVVAGKNITVLGGVVSAPAFTNVAGGTIQGFGQLSGDVSNSGSASFNGPTEIIGNLTNSAGGQIAVRNDKLIVTGTGTNNGSITTSNGTVIFDGGVVAGPALSGALRVGPSGGAVAPFYRGQQMTIDGSAGSAGGAGVATVRETAFGGDTSVLKDLSIAGTTDTWLGRFDVADTDVVIDYGGASPIATVQNQVKSAFNNGLWTGNGITSSSAAAQASSAHRTALGIVEASDLGLTSFSGLAVDSTSVLTRYTASGDANVDGTVNTTDFNLLAANFGQDGRRWFNGDFNYDGLVNTTDFNLLASNFGFSVPAPAGSAGLGALVPEPSCVALLSFAALLSRRRLASFC